MKKVIRLTESDLTRIVRKVISEQEKSPKNKELIDCLNSYKFISSPSTNFEVMFNKKIGDFNAMIFRGKNTDLYTFILSTIDGRQEMKKTFPFFDCNQFVKSIKEFMSDNKRKGTSERLFSK